MLGVAIAYFILPFAIAFLFSFTDDGPGRPPAAGQYFDFVTTLFLVFGLDDGVPDPARRPVPGRDRDVGPGCARRGGWSSSAIAIFAAVATPGGDLVSPIVLGGTMYILFELTVMFIRRSGR